MYLKVENYAAMQTALDELCTFLIENGISQDLVFDSKLIACELLGNVLKYTEGESGLYGEIKDGFIGLKISSNSYFALPEKIVCSDILSEHGRGLFLVNKLSGGRIVSEEDGIFVKIKIDR